MSTTYDLLILTNLPSFYKINLYNQISKNKKIKVLFICNNSTIRNSDFTNAEIEFDYDIISYDFYENRNKIKVFLSLIKKIYTIKYEKIFYSGWETIEVVPLLYLVPKNKNNIIIESSILESNVTGFKGFIKRIFVSRCSDAFPSGKLQIDLLKALNFTGNIHITHGVGLLNPSFYQMISEKRSRNVDKKFIYVGRLSSEKNIKYLIDSFNINGKKLTIVGDGPEFDYLYELANDNITFSGYINNEIIKKLLLEHDVFILPSVSEVWGLVVEEALFSGLPVLVSENVGCKFDLVESPKTGLVFKLNDISDINSKIEEINDNYDFYYNNVLHLKYSDRVKLQVEAYF
ncbi:glycosyltransferase [Photobacterium leiognathi]|uniref:glycosyltransferase n=1 Tax=Photobacterium leiognathi TaxID=553611 RepID=UPI0029823E60|nr:glycosyltransferase [Photobacterium leiognathi]